ncbi:glycosyltransferase [Bacillus sp. JJ1533]|uniref:glycosyltransferase n=1 Tax=Bacillus sp. JJ1533 TaxID=3122959 RepID=UPI0030000AE7
MKKIALFIPRLTIGGAEKVMISIANGLSERGHDVDLVVISKEGDLAGMVSPSVTVVDLQSKRTFCSILALKKYIEEKRPDVLLSALDNANIVAGLAKILTNTDTKLVLSIHTNLQYSYEHPRTFIQRFYPFLLRRVFKQADAVIAVSKCVAALSSKFLNYPLEKVKVIYNPVIHEEIYELANEDQEHLWLQENRSIPAVVAVGRIVEAKDYPTLIHAFAKVVKRTKARLIIVGDGKEKIKKDMESLIQSYEIRDVVDITGYKKNPYYYIKNADLLVSSSKLEGFGNVLVEALALRTPIVSTNCQCGPSEILLDGRLGSLEPVGDVDALAKAIEQRLTNQYAFDEELLTTHLRQMEAQAAVLEYEKVVLQE